MSRAKTFALAVIGLVSVPVCATGQELRYRWKTGERYVYSVKIEIEGEEIIEEMSGTNQSKDALEKASRDKNGSVANAAKDALKTIAGRK